MAVSVLIIESDEPTLQMLTSAFEGAGVTVHAALDGTAGLELAEQLVPALILAAVELPGFVSGYTICKRVKQSATLATVPLFLMSASASLEQLEQHRKLR